MSRLTKQLAVITHCVACDEDFQAPGPIMQLTHMIIIAPFPHPLLLFITLELLFSFFPCP